MADPKSVRGIAVFTCKFHPTWETKPGWRQHGARVRTLLPTRSKGSKGSRAPPRGPAAPRLDNGAALCYQEFVMQRAFLKEVSQPVVKLGTDRKSGV